MDTFFRLVVDDTGFVISIELILIATILVIGLIAGLTAVRDAVVAELADVGSAIQSMNQSFRVSGVSSPSAATAGSEFIDRSDSVEQADGNNCIIVFGVADEF